MSGVNWGDVRLDVEKCGNVKEIEECLMKCGVLKENVFRVMRSSVSGYGRDRDYREKRNKGLGEMSREIKRLEGLLKSK